MTRYEVSSMSEPTSALARVCLRLRVQRLRVALAHRLEAAKLARAIDEYLRARETHARDRLAQREVWASEARSRKSRVR